MLGWKLFTRALRLLIENLDDALRVSLVPYAIVAVAEVFLALSYPDQVSAAGFDPSLAADGDYIAANLGVFVLSLVVSLWIAVAWHRYVLLSEQPAGVLPPMNGGAMLGYFGLSIGIGLLIAVVILLISFPIGALLFALPFASVLAGAASTFVAMIVFYRLAIVLPARAIDRPMTFREGWEATKGHSGTAVVLALLTVGFSMLLQVPNAIGSDSAVIVILYQIVVGWIGLMIGVSTLTALYGHLVEGRPVE